MKINISGTYYRKPVEEWSNRDFLLYFSLKLFQLTGQSLIIPTEAWPGFLARIKGFRNKLHISNAKYKEFIDSLFSSFFAKSGYIPAFGAAVSEKVFYVVMVRTKPTYLNFEVLRNELYKNNLWFQKISDQEITPLISSAL